MLLSRIHLDPRCKEARRDLADPYQLHSTLCRAFSTPDMKCPPGTFLWRLEPETNTVGFPRIVLQSEREPNWAGIDVSSWMAACDPPIDLEQKLGLDALRAGSKFRFRLRANPCATRNGKRQGLLRRDEQVDWLKRKGQLHGFSIEKASIPRGGESSFAVQVTQEKMLTGKQRSGRSIRVFSAMYDGVLKVDDPDRFKATIRKGIGHGKVMGLGLLSVVPWR